MFLEIWEEKDRVMGMYSRVGVCVRMRVKTRMS